MQPAPAPSAQKVRIHVSAKNLEKTKTDDPLCTLYIKNIAKNRWDTVGSTEFIKKNLNPQWMSTFLIPYNPQTQQLLKFVVFMHQPPRNGNQDVEYGNIEIDLKNLIENPKNNKFTLQLNSTPVNGTLIIGFEMDNEKDQNNSMIACQIQLKNSGKLHWYRKNKIFYEISRPTPNCDDYFVIYRSPITKSEFPPLTIQATRLFANTGDLKFPLRITFYDHDVMSNLVNLGSYDTSYENINANLKKPFSLTATSKDGKIIESTFAFESIRTLQYTPFNTLQSRGLGLNLEVFIDMSFSLKPKEINDSSLMNGQIIKPCLSILEILLSHFTNHTFSAYRLSYETSDKNGSHFTKPLPLVKQGVDVDGINGFIAAYKTSAKKDGFIGTTAFHPTVREILEICDKKMKELNSYTVAVIVAPYKFYDFNITTDIMQLAWNKPLSFIIVGVCDDQDNLYRMRDFANEDLFYKSNGNNNPNRRPMPRQFVNFVDYEREVENQSDLDDLLFGPIPNQVSAYEALRNLL